MAEKDCVIAWPWPATKGSHGFSAAPSAPGVGRRIERKRQKLVGLDKGSLTEQQTKGTVTTTIWIRRTHKINSRTHRATLTACCRAHAPKPRQPSRRPAPPNQKPA